MIFHHKFLTISAKADLMISSKQLFAQLVSSLPNNLNTLYVLSLSIQSRGNFILVPLPDHMIQI